MWPSYLVNIIEALDNFADAIAQRIFCDRGRGRP